MLGVDGGETGWMERAACRPEPGWPERRLQLHVEVFFPPDGDYRRAAAICAECVVRPECALYTARIAPSHGWWAGQVKDKLGPESSALRKRLGCTRCGDPVGASGLRRPGGRWCSLYCYRADQMGLPLLHVDRHGDPSPQERPA